MELMIASARCRRCRRPLSDPLAIALGYGRTCLEREGLAEPAHQSRYCGTDAREPKTVARIEAARSMRAMVGRPGARLLFPDQDMAFFKAAMQVYQLA